MTDDELIEAVEQQRTLMISVATGGARISNTNEEYVRRRREIGAALGERGLEDPNPFLDLWRWYGRWQNGDLPTYRSRRAFVSDMYDPLVQSLERRRNTGTPLFEEPTGWERVDRCLANIRQQLGSACDEEEYQAVGLMCREALITLAQVLFDADLHWQSAEEPPGPTDARRMLDAYVESVLRGEENEELRRFVGAALRLANSVQHRRTAGFVDAAACAEAIYAVVNVLAVVSRRRGRILDGETRSNGQGAERNG